MTPETFGIPKIAPKREDAAALDLRSFMESAQGRALLTPNIVHKGMESLFQYRLTEVFRKGWEACEERVHKALL